jgi:uncharacterized protein with HEPN domain
VNELRLDDYLEHIESAARGALEFVGSQSRDEFLADIKTQHAVAMSFATMGEAATRIAANYPDFVASSPEISWRDMRGTRHHLVHGYFRIDYNVVWDTVHNEPPPLLQQSRG